ncbi:lipoamide acyltransferase component of branched-chain alpha-keto acid dehydrogenase complex, mitochondrial [Coffea eugenioides]|uniref:lipoamide acyltransferase component of branched-chain alpha-keto acid dehydrogenase complex, mitochondrial n=1 Tax=Coffea eugenioides TaxID=49369 RepID=UPI000F61307B|nr:lipoamide acyltransferase component of branched-chain alpha-keto acid dehydrogenase complex, mitochondrial [Coffea eugenioides]
MLCRRMHQRKPWITCRRWLYSSTALTRPPVATGGPGQGPTTTLSLGSTSQASIFPCSTMSFLQYIKLNESNYEFGMRRCCFSTQVVVDSPVGGIVDIPLAQTGEGIAECELLKWFIQEGDEVEEFQPLCEVQSDKATIEITSRYKGKVSQILHVPGNIVKVGETLLKMIVDETACPMQTLHPLDNLDCNGLEGDSPSSVLQRSAIKKVLSTPAVRSLAKEYGIDINDVVGTGKDGRVLREDVLNYVAKKENIKDLTSLGAYSGEQSQVADNSFEGISGAYGWEFEDKTVTLRGYQRAMIKSMSSAAKIPHFHYVEEINCDALVELKSSFHNENSDPDVKFTFLPILIKSLSMAISKYPWLNSSLNEELNEVTLKGSHNVGVAMATPHGLVVPNIKKVQSLSILEITKELSRLQQLALANKLNPDDITGGTITLSNIGAIGGKFGSPLVNVPEVCIIALGRIQKVPQFAEDGNVYPMSVLTVNIGADHRVLDGATVARFCNEWKLYIEKPELLMLHMR